MRKVTLIMTVALALFAFTGTLVFAHSVSVTLMGQNASGQNGTAQILDNGDGTSTVVIEVSNGTDTPQPAHVHAGTCANLDPTPAYPLNNVVNGRSTTVLSVDVDTLTDGTFAVNVHKSVPEASVYTSCGDISTAQEIEHTPGSTPGMPTTGSSSDLVLGALALLATILLGAGLQLSRRTTSA